MNPFEYVSPKQVEDVPGLLGRKRGRTTALIAGGIDLLGEMKDNLVEDNGRFAYENKQFEFEVADLHLHRCK